MKTRLNRNFTKQTVEPLYVRTHIYGSVSDKGVTLQYPDAKYHVFNLSTSYVFILILSYVSICSMCYV